MQNNSQRNRKSRTIPALLCGKFAVKAIVHCDGQGVELQMAVQPNKLLAIGHAID